ncbi:MAG: hypothetical protein PHF17_07875 [Arcobacteraceae bacterium]|nr:hypothetical protein [Arcobacteraceae bacterium]
MEFQDNIELRVLLLAIYKKKEDESFKDILKMMDNSRVFDLKKGKQYIKELKALGFLTDDSITFLGIEEAKKVELEFKL